MLELMPMPKPISTRRRMKGSWIMVEELQSHQDLIMGTSMGDELSGVLRLLLIRCVLSDLHHTNVVSSNFSATAKTSVPVSWPRSEYVLPLPSEPSIRSPWISWNSCLKANS
jgi:hypothetical protein